MKYDPCKATSIMVPYIVLRMIIKSKKNHFLITALPMSLTTISFHHKLIDNIRKYDIAISLIAYIHHIIYYNLYAKKKRNNYFIIPGTLYLVDKIFEDFNFIKTSHYFHALSHLSVIPCVYLNTIIK